MADLRYRMMTWRPADAKAGWHRAVAGGCCLTDSIDDSESGADSLHQSEDLGEFEIGGRNDTEALMACGTL